MYRKSTVNIILNEEKTESILSKISVKKNVSTFTTPVHHTDSTENFSESNQARERGMNKKGRNQTTLICRWYFECHPPKKKNSTRVLSELKQKFYRNMTQNQYTNINTNISVYQQ